MLRPSPSPRLLKPKSPEEWRLGSNCGEERLEQLAERPRLEPDPAVGDDDLGLVGRRRAGPRGATSPPSGVNLMALVSRLSTASSILSASTSNVAEVVGDLVDSSVWRRGGDERLDLVGDVRGAGRRGRPGRGWRVWRKSSARIRVRVLATSLASCRALPAIRSTISRSCSARGRG